MKKLVCLFLIVASSILLWKCASQTTPTGGPKDTKPPVLKKSVPSANETNFKGKQVELTFDELLKLNNAKEEIIISPSPGKDVLFSLKQNKVFIEPKNGWADNTTYSIAFREGVQDLNEGNPAENLHLAFSTGPTIDSLQVSGKVSESLTEKLPEKITVALYQQDTFDIFEDTPAFFTKINKDGSFKIENLKPGDYYIYAWDDKNKNLKVDSRNEKFGFIPKAIHPRPTNPTYKDTLIVSIYQVDSRPPKITSVRNTGTITQIRLNKNLSSYRLLNPSKAKINHVFGTNQSEIAIYNDLQLNDSVAVTLQATDSLQLKVDSTFYIKRIESKIPKEKFTNKIASASFNPETFQVQAEIRFSKPINKISIDSIYLTPDAVPEKPKKQKSTDKEKGKSKNEKTSTPIKSDTLKKDTATVKPIIKIPIQQTNISIDTIRQIITLKTTIDKKLITTKVKQLNLVTEELFLLSIESDSSKREIKSIPIADSETTGILHIEVKTKYKNYEIRLLTAGGQLIDKVRNVKKHSFKYLQPQEYKILFYPDLNNNRYWDAQNIYERKNSEPTFFYKSQEGKFTFPIRSAWELGPLLLEF